jgi:hypothetical protein
MVGRIGAQIRTVTKHFAAMGGPNGRCHQSNPHLEEGDEYNVEDEIVNLFAERRVRRECPLVQTNISR